MPEKEPKPDKQKKNLILPEDTITGGIPEIKDSEHIGDLVSASDMALRETDRKIESNNQLAHLLPPTNELGNPEG